MKKNYPKSSIQNFIRKSILRTKCKKFLIFIFVFLSSLNSYSQCNVEIPTPFISDNFDILSTSSSTSGLCLVGCGITDEGNLIDTSLDNFATVSFGLGIGAVHKLTVTDGNTVYPLGTFAGFKIGPSGGLLSLDLLSAITVNTYNSGVLKESVSASSLLSLSLVSSPGNYVVGFNTSQSFDAIELVFDGTITLLSSTNVYYAVVRQYCAGPSLECNVATTMSLPTYPVIIDTDNTGLSGVSVGSIDNTNNVISSSTTDFATIDLTLGLLASGSIAVKDQITDYPIGNYAGFEIENSNLVDLSALGNITVSTYMDGVFQEQFSGNNLIVNGTLLNASGRYKVGFVTTKAFDEVQFSINQILGASLGVTKVYGAIFENFCAGSDLQCNTQTAVTAPDFPVFINGQNTGINGIACLLCNVINQDNLIDADDSNYAQVDLTTAVGASGSVSVKDQITDYPVGTFAGYTIENPALLSVDALDAIRVTTYLNGVQQETKTGNGALVSVGTDLLVGTSKQTIGFITTLPFDEVKLTLTNLVSVDLGIVKVYQAIFQKLCEPVVECYQSYDWTNPDFPVTVNGANSGIEGVACVACGVNDANNLITADDTDFAQITLTAGVLASGSVSVKEELYTYPKGTFAGFKIRDLNALVQLDLFSSLTIYTYNDGVLQESKSGGDLIDLTLLGGPLFGSGAGYYEVGFHVTLPFDEIKLGVNSIASVVNTINVFGAFVNTSNSDGTGTTGSLLCDNSSISITKEGIYVDNNSDGIVNVGDTIEYTFDVTNTGDTTLTNVIVTDDKATVSGTPIPVLLPGEHDNTSYTAVYYIQQSDIDSGVVFNLAIAKGTTLIGEEVTANSTDPTPCASCPVDPTCPTCTATPLTQSPSLAFVKTAVYNGDPSKAQVGDIITYTFTVTNTGNVTVDNIKINDAQLGVTDLAITPSSLAPSSSGVVTKDYAITQGDIDAGKVTNTAIAKGQDPEGNDVQDTSGTAVDNDTNTVTTLPQSPSLAFVKTAVYNGDPSKAQVGDIITYTFTVTNTGNVTVANIKINDAQLGVTDLAITPSSLAPSSSGVATKDYAITQGDIDAGKVTNTAIAKGQDPEGNDVQDTSGTAVDNDANTVTTLPESSSIAMVKTSSLPTFVGVGGIIIYTFSVTNTGNTTIKNIVVTDPLPGLNMVNNTIVSLAPGVSDNSITGIYIVTQSDMDANKVVNSALAVGKDPDGNNVSDISGTTITNDNQTETPLVQNPSISLIKEGIYEDTNEDGVTSVGDKVKYTFLIENTGNAILYTVNLIDDTATVLGTPVVTLGVGESNSTAFTAEYVITQEDINLGVVYNLAVVTANTSLGVNVTNTSVDPTPCMTCPINLECPTCTMTELIQSPKLALIKEGIFEDTNGDGQAQIGETIRYNFTVMNVGNVPLTNVWIEDSMIGFGTANGSVDLPIGATDNSTFYGIYTITQQDIIAGFVTNQAKATGTSVLGVEIQDLSDDTNPLEDDATVLALNGCILQVFNAVSPDGDGHNDYLRIGGIDCYPNNTVQIFDRWGVKVFDLSGYDNNLKAFKGMSEGRVTFNQSEGLPSGTYFYFIQYVDKNGIGFNKSGYLHLIKE